MSEGRRAEEGEGTAEDLGVACAELERVLHSYLTEVSDASRELNADARSSTEAAIIETPNNLSKSATPNTPPFVCCDQSDPVTSVANMVRDPGPHDGRLALHCPPSNIRLLYAPFYASTPGSPAGKSSSQVLAPCPTSSTSKRANRAGMLRPTSRSKN